MKNESDEITKWTWAAAIAVEDRRLQIAERSKLLGDAMPWGKGKDMLAEALVVRLKDPSRLEDLLRRPDSVPRPRGVAESWDELAGELWAALGVAVEPSALQVGDFFLATPYHLHIATDSKHPHYDRRVLREITPAFVASLRLLGVNTRPVTVCPHHDDDDSDRLYVKAGRKRIRGARMANNEGLGEWLFAARSAWQKGGSPLLVDAPKLLRWMATRFFDPDTAERIARQDHDHQDKETVLEASEAAIALKALGHTVDEIADLKNASHASIVNYLSLANLHKDLASLLQEGRLRPGSAYRLARAPSKARQIEIWQQVKDLGDEAQRRAIDALLAGQPIPKTIKQKVLPQAKLFRLVETFHDCKRGTQLHGIRLGLQLAAGDPKALAELPKDERVALQRLMK